MFNDPQNRWMSHFLQADESGDAPASYSRKTERLRMIELYCRLVRHHRAIPGGTSLEQRAAKHPKG